MRTLTCASALLGSFLLDPASAHACFMPPDHMYLSHEEVIADAEWIARVRAERDLSGGPGRLIVRDYLKGGGPEVIMLPQPPDTPEARMALHNSDPGWVDGAYARVEYDWPSPQHSRAPGGTNFYGHRTSEFWTEGSLNFNATDCRIWPRFHPGAEYLIFGPLDYNLGFENISGDDDVWLEFVRDRVSDGEAEAPFPVPLDEFLVSAHAVVRLKARLEGGELVYEEIVLKGDMPSYLDQIFILPEAEISDQIICRARDPWWDGSQIDHLYVIEQPASGPDWHSSVLLCSRDAPDGDPFGPHEGVYLHSRGQFTHGRLRTFGIDEEERVSTDHSIRHRSLFTEPHADFSSGIPLSEIEAILARQD